MPCLPLDYNQQQKYVANAVVDALEGALQINAKAGVQVLYII